MTFLVFYLKSSSLNFLMKHVFIATFCSYLLIVVSMYIQFRNSTKLSLVIIVFFFWEGGGFESLDAPIENIKRC